MSIDQFIERNIYCCLTAIVEHCSTLDLEFQDQVYSTLTITCQECDGTGYGEDDDYCHECDGEGYHTKEPLEWWGVSRLLAERLKSNNEIIIQNFNLYLWGRTCSGVALSNDPSITDIFEALK